MRRHPTDLAALLLGLCFLAVGGGFLAHELSAAADPAWVLAAALTATGVAFLAVTLLRPGARDAPDPGAGGPAPGPDDPAGAGAGAEVGEGWTPPTGLSKTDP